MNRKLTTQYCPGVDMQDDIARLLNVSQSVVSRHLKDNRERETVLQKGNGLH